jgi:hypothetical protein
MCHTKNKKYSCMEEMGVLSGGLEATPVAWKIIHAGLEGNLLHFFLKNSNLSHQDFSFSCYYNLDPNSLPKTRGFS